MDLELRNSENGLNGQSIAVALLIDGENLSAEHSATLLDVAANAGRIVVRRVYGDANLLAAWEFGRTNQKLKDLWPSDANPFRIKKFRFYNK